MLSFLNGPIRTSKPERTAPSTIPMSKLAIGLLLLFSTAASNEPGAQEVGAEAERAGAAANEVGAAAEEVILRIEGKTAPRYHE
jgi:hypothetical protein